MIRSQRIREDGVGTIELCTLSRTSDVIDTSNKESGADQRVIAGRKSSTISIDSLYLPTVEAFNILEDKYEARESIVVKRVVEGNERQQARAFITDFSEGHPDNDVSTVSLELTIDGGWVDC